MSDIILVTKKWKIFFVEGNGCRVSFMKKEEGTAGIAGLPL
jgi:hypothetical protein